MNGLRGPAPTPTPLRTGRSAQPSRMNPDEPQPRPGSTKGRGKVKPLWDIDDEALDVWRHATRELEHMGVLFHTDLALLTAWCQAVAFLRSAGRLVEKSGVVVIRSKSGGFSNVAVSNPAGREFDRYYRLVLAGAREFGLTPSARTRIMLGASSGDGDTGDTGGVVDETFLQRLRDAARRRGEVEASGQ